MTYPSNAILTPEDWLLQRTLTPSPSDARSLARNLRDAGLRVDALVLARDAATTLGRHLLTFRHGWPGGTSPFGDIFVADLGSTDNTREIALESDAIVLAPESPRAAALAPPADGDGVFRTLSTSRADILLVLPANLLRVDLDALAAMVDSFRRFPSLLLAQGFQSSSIGGLSANLARPLLSALLPELGMLADPTCPVLAIRRPAFLASPIARTSGYEASLVVEAWKQGGLESLAQVRLPPLEFDSHRAPDESVSFRCCLALLESLRRARRLSTPQEFGHIASSLVDMPSGSLQARAQLQVFAWSTPL